MTRFIPGRLSLLSVVFAAVSSSCAPAPPPDTRAADEAAIRANEVAFSAAAGAKDVNTLMTYYAPDIVALPPNEPKADGSAATRKMWEGSTALPGFSVSWVADKVEVSGDLGYSVGTYSLTMNGPDGKPANDKGKYMEVWKRQPDKSWKVSYDMFNSDLPVAAPPAPETKKK